MARPPKYPSIPLHPFGIELEKIIEANNLTKTTVAFASGLDRAILTKMGINLESRLNRENVLRCIEGLIGLEAITSVRKANDLLYQASFNEVTKKYDNPEFKKLDESNKRDYQVLALIRDKQRQRQTAREQALDRPQEWLVHCTPDFAPHEKLMRGKKLVGREEEFNAIWQALQDDRFPVVTITGVVGVGKTKLAIEIFDRKKHELPTMFPGGHQYISLVPVTNPKDVPRYIAEKLGVSEPTAERIAVRLPNKPALLAIDNLEHVLKDQKDFFIELLNCVYGDYKKPLKLLLTSQRILDDKGGRELPIVIRPLKVPPEGTPVISKKDIPNYSAIDLFYQYARRLNFTAEDIGYTVRICREFNGVPLPIRLAAARISDRLSPKEYYTLYIKRRTEEMSYNYVNDNPRQPSWFGAIASSYDLLEPPEKTLFCRLSLFLDGCTTYAANKICNFDRAIATDKSQIQELLDRLVEYCLLEKEGYDENARYSMLHTIYLFALEKRHEQLSKVQEFALKYAIIADPQIPL